MVSLPYNLTDADLQTHPESKLAHWDTGYLDLSLRNLVCATYYAGHVDVSFPDGYSKVLVQNTATEHKLPQHEPQDPTSLRTRLSKCFHRDRPKTAQLTVWAYHGIRTIWPHVSGPPEDWGRKPLKQGEKEWFDQWSGPIRSAVIMKRRTWLTENHYMTFKAGLDNVQQPKYSWGRDEVRVHT